MRLRPSDAGQNYLNKKANMHHLISRRNTRAGTTNGRSRSVIRSVILCVLQFLSKNFSPRRDLSRAIDSESSQIGASLSLARETHSCGEYTLRASSRTAASPPAHLCTSWKTFFFFFFIATRELDSRQVERRSTCTRRGASEGEYQVLNATWRA